MGGRGGSRLGAQTGGPTRERKIAWGPNKRDYREMEEERVDATCVLSLLIKNNKRAVKSPEFWVEGLGYVLSMFTLCSVWGKDITGFNLGKFKFEDKVIHHV